MFLDPVAPALELLARYGLVAVFVLLVIDSAGIPFPTELVLIMAVALYATDVAGMLLVLVVATAAAVLGSLLLYGVCFLGGRRLVEKRPRLFMMTPRRLERLERVFRRPAGKSLVFFLRLFPLTRVFVSIPAGIARMKPAAFIVLTILGMVVYNAVLVWLAFRYGAGGTGGATVAAATASPAWEYFQVNRVVTFLILVALGLVLSFVTSRSTLKDPAWSSPSRLGWLAERVAVLGGLAVLVLTIVQPELVYRALLWGGLDLPALAERLNWDAESFLVVAAVLAILVGVPLLVLGRRARRAKEEQFLRAHGVREDAEVFVKPVAGVAWAVDPTDRTAKPPRGPRRRL